MEAHTETPWEVDPTGEYIQRVGDTELGICSMLNMDPGGDKGWFRGPITAANARRIVACVNACQNIPTELLEEVAGMMPVVMPYRLLKRSHELLLEALEKSEALMAQHFDCADPWECPEDLAEHRKAIRDALAKSTELELRRAEAEQLKVGV